MGTPSIMAPEVARAKLGSGKKAVQAAFSWGGQGEAQLATSRRGRVGLRSRLKHVKKHSKHLISRGFRQVEHDI